MGYSETRYYLSRRKKPTVTAEIGEGEGSRMPTLHEDPIKVLGATVHSTTR